MIEISERNMLYIKGGVMGDIKNKNEGYKLLSEDFLRENKENLREKVDFIIRGYLIIYTTGFSSI